MTRLVTSSLGAGKPGSRAASRCRDHHAAAAVGRDPVAGHESESTVKTHIKRVMAKLSLSSRARAGRSGL
jgi:hypothetical protein